MGRITQLLLLFILPVFAWSQQTTDTSFHIQSIKAIVGSFVNFTVDNLGNIFLVTANNQLKKFNNNLDSAGVFNDVRRYGDVYSVDVNNPLKIVLYYRSFTTILVLDRFLNTRNTIDLRSSGILQARVVTQSYDNNYWVFDELENKIKKIDDNGKVLLESTDFRMIFPDSYTPQRMIDENGMLFLYDEQKGWLIFDYYGAFKQHIDFTGWKDVNVIKDNLSGRDKNAFYTVNRKTFNQFKITSDTDLSQAIKIQRQADKLYVLNKDGLNVYSLP